MFSETLGRIKKFMARPSVVRPTDGGEISLKGCSKETIDKVRSILSGESLSPPTPSTATSDGGTEIATPTAVSSPTPSATPATDETPMHCNAVGVYQNPLTLTWHFCELKFSPYSKRAVVSIDRPISRDKYECDEAFKIGAVHSGLIG
jgi:hypothetical protein